MPHFRRPSEAEVSDAHKLGRTFDRSIIFLGVCHSGSPTVYQRVPPSGAYAWNGWGYTARIGSTTIKLDTEVIFKGMGGMKAIGGVTTNHKAVTVDGSTTAHSYRRHALGNLGDNERLYRGPRIEEIKVWWDKDRDNSFASSEKVYDWAYTLGTVYPSGLPSPPPICGAGRYKIELLFSKKMNKDFTGAQVALDPGPGYGFILPYMTYAWSGTYVYPDTWKGCFEIPEGNSAQIDSVPGQSRYCEILVTQEDALGSTLDKDGDGVEDADGDRNHRLNVDTRQGKKGDDSQQPAQ